MTNALQPLRTPQALPVNTDVPNSQMEKSHLVPQAAEELSRFTLGAGSASLPLPTGRQLPSKVKLRYAEKSTEVGGQACLPTRTTKPPTATTLPVIICLKLFLWQTVNNNMQGINSQLKHMPNISLCTQSKVICMFTVTLIKQSRKVTLCLSFSWSFPPRL